MIIVRRFGLEVSGSTPMRSSRLAVVVEKTKNRRMKKTKSTNVEKPIGIIRNRRSKGMVDGMFEKQVARYAPVSEIIDGHRTSLSIRRT